jgi:uncharacterized protein YndB with AHSA1/START domain
MIRVEIDTVIAGPIEEVFDCLVNINGYAQWLPQSRVFRDTTKTSGGPVGVGTTFRDDTTVGAYQGEVTAFARPTQVDFRMRLRWFGIDVMESRPGYRLAPVNGDTRVRLVAEGELYGPFKLAEPFVDKIAWQERQRTLAALKRSLEAPSG